MNQDLYKQDGVDISAGDEFSRYCNEINKSTYGLSKFVEITDLSRGNFRGPKSFEFVNLPKGCKSTAASDGIGTKVGVITAARNHYSTAENLIAMTGMDITRWGGLPLIFMNIFDVRSLGEIDSENFERCKMIMEGLRYLALTHKYVLFTGETAELGPYIGSENPHANPAFNWCGTMLGVYHPQKMILGDTLKAGQIIVALKDGFRSNGYSSVRKALAIKYGEAWWANPAADYDIGHCAKPSAQYDRMLNHAHGWYQHDPINDVPFDLHLVVHLSGGAFESKLGADLLKPLGLSAEINDLFEPPEIMEKCAEWRGMSQKDCYKTWNGGQGAIVVLDDLEEAEDFIKFAEQFRIHAKVCGEITKQKAYTVAIRSKFGNREMIYY